ncbi:hypothetical protein AGABI2DRAFT_193814 [Agaricus bisporus var. bisporus H97]|uniref:hypothetical protein n=1 Tax=Agaricus bisporus var. bisporus (strain H97 / ATCC MYA-4626 / FGSC 10389) TaxID=936046 RepID=UPI00029F7EE2|nr:hypothetical protein AGABI2DRAFT_193814 [Agaricus bisporus var. bisporus H97]EKV45890.1 hypothetical protein AGABI2DRAFT_193814 [Agaricus bisporus var. bisporus H97]
MSEPDILLAFKAGRAFRRETSNSVDPSSTKGAILLVNGEDGLLHFQWKNRETGQLEEDLILFPSDASFVKVEQASGRVYVLKFSSSNQRHFFWLQDASSARDEEFVNNLNGLLEDPEYQVQWSSNSSTTTQSQAPASTSTSSSTTTTVPTSATSARTTSATTTSRPSDSIVDQVARNANDFHVTPEQLAALSNALGSLQGQSSSSGMANALPELALTDILSPTNIAPLFSSHPELLPALYHHLPPDLPIPPSPETLQRVISSPQFRGAVSSFDQGLQTGLLGGFVRSFGLPEEAGIGILPFLRAIQEQADKDRRSGSATNEAGDNMQTD